MPLPGESAGRPGLIRERGSSTVALLASPQLCLGWGAGFYITIAVVCLDLHCVCVCWDIMRCPQELFDVSTSGVPRNIFELSDILSSYQPVKTFHNVTQAFLLELFTDGALLDGLVKSKIKV